jgi:hypothetical protein
MNSASLPATLPPSLEPPVRPTRFTIWCGLGIVNAIYTIWWLFTPAAVAATGGGTTAMGDLFIAGTLAATVLGLIGLTGYWCMRRWGVYVYTAAAILMAAAVLAGAGPTVVAIRMGVMAGFGWFFLRTMV